VISNQQLSCEGKSAINFFSETCECVEDCLDRSVSTGALPVPVVCPVASSIFSLVLIWCVADTRGLRQENSKLVGVYGLGVCQRGSMVVQF
jgi:hypothetical protein